jgi:hypothetical protein
MPTSTQIHGAVATVRGHPPREARLRPEHAAGYPDVRPGRWDPAATVADRVLAGRLLRGSLTARRGRALPDEHFEFRGGTAPGREREGSRPRREDR